VICETKCIWSHYLLFDREKSLPDLALSPCTRAGPQFLPASWGCRCRLSGFLRPHVPRR
jgi:hypothetical protein